MYSCWNRDHTERPTAPEIVDFLAMNPRILSPCLDVPIASVQIDHTGQFDLQIDNILQRKFSLSWPPQTNTCSSTSPIEIPSPPLLDINCQDDKNQECLLGDAIGDLESSKPLLMNSGESSSGPGICLQSFKRNEEEGPRYVNIQPGMANNVAKRNDSAGTIQMEERTVMLPENRNSEDVSIL